MTKSMTSARPTRAMILAAGSGARLRPLTNDRPKPLIDIAGRPIIDYMLDRLAAAGVEQTAVNAHYLADQLAAHLARRTRPSVRVVREARLLDTGGGVRNALALLRPQPFFVANADVLWLDGPTPALDRLAAAWRDEAMDALLLTVSIHQARSMAGLGDFWLDPWGRVSRPEERLLAPSFYAGVQLVHPRLFDGAPDGPFSFNLLWDEAIARGRLYGIRHDGVWFHVGSHDGLAEARDLMSADRVRWLGQEAGP